MTKVGVLLFLGLFTTLLSATPSGTDLHAYWDQRCGDCHGHSAEFARRFLRVEDGRLLGVHHRKDLDVFLRNHYLSDGLVAPVTAMLAAQVVATPIFRDKCSGCHGSAAAFARKSLLIRNGDLVGASNGRKVADYLVSHGGIERKDIPPVVDSLTRVYKELAGPGP